MNEFLRDASHLLARAKAELVDLRGHFIAYVGILGAFATIAVGLMPAETHTIFVASALLLLAYPAALVGWRVVAKWAIIEPPNVPVRRFRAIPYSLTSDLDMKELSAFAAESFKGDTIPADVVLGAVRGGCLLGLRITPENGSKNIGFFDVIHFREDIFNAWLNGDIDESALRPEHFVPIDQSASAKSPLKLAVGALYLRRRGLTADWHLTQAFVGAAKEYLEEALPHTNVELYATMFSEDGARWADLMGFKPHIDAAKRRGLAKAHDVWVRYPHGGNNKQLSVLQTRREGILTFVTLGERYQYEVMLERPVP